MNFGNFSTGGIAGGPSMSGQIGTDELGALQKALTSGYGTDSSELTGGSALRIQSLDRVMKATIVENRHFALFNVLQKSNATATVDEWTEQSGIGGFLGGSTNTETGNISSAEGDYARRVGMVKYLMTRREVSVVATITNNISSAEAVEAKNGALQLLQDAEFLSFEGDSTVVPTEFDGLYRQMLDLNDSNHVIDLAGSSLSHASYIDRAAAEVAGMGNFGRASHLFLSQLAQSDLNASLETAYRVPLTNVPNGGLEIGAPVGGVRTSWGDVATVPDIFVRDEYMQRPFAVMYPAIAAKNAYAPAKLAIAASETGSTSSAWKAAHTGNYYYAVAGVSSSGESSAVVSDQVAVTAGGKVVLTITASLATSETGYAIYRGRLGGTNDLSDMRLVKRIPKDSSGTTTFTDENADIPGTTKAFMLSMGSGADAISWRQLLPMTRFDLFPTVSAVKPWAQLLFGYLRIQKRRQHAVFKNILPNGAIWKPFN